MPVMPEMIIRGGSQTLNRAHYHPLLDPTRSLDSFLADPCGFMEVSGALLDGDGNLSIAAIQRGEGGAPYADGDRYFIKNKTAATTVLTDFPTIKPYANAGAADKAFEGKAGTLQAGTAYRAFNMPVSPSGWLVFAAVRRGASMPNYAGQNNVRPIVQFPGAAIDGDTSSKVFLGGFDATADPTQALATAGSHLGDPSSCSAVTGWGTGKIALLEVMCGAEGVTLTRDGRFTGVQGDYFDGVEQGPDLWFLLGCEINGASADADLAFLYATPADSVTLAQRRLIRAWALTEVLKRNSDPDNPNYYLGGPYL